MGCKQEECLGPLVHMEILKRPAFAMAGGGGGGGRHVKRILTAPPRLAELSRSVDFKVFIKLRLGGLPADRQPEFTWPVEAFHVDFLQKCIPSE